jgi:hypothetical protein
MRTCSSSRKLEAELKATELDTLDDVTEPSVSPSFTSRPAVRTSTLTARASFSAATSVTTSASTRGACTSRATLGVTSRLDAYQYQYDTREGREYREGKGHKGSDRPVKICTAMA